MQPDGFHGPTIFSPGTPTEVKEDSRLTTVGPGYFATLERDDGGTVPYTVTALTQVGGEKPGELNDAVLEAAGTDYPQSIKDLYLGVAPGQIGDNAQKLEDRVRAESPSQTPFDLAQTMVKDPPGPERTSRTRPTSATSIALRSRRSSASRPTRRASASTTHRRWPC